MTPGALGKLAGIIAEKAARLESHPETTKSTDASFDFSVALGAESQAEKDRMELINAAKELLHMVQKPAEVIHDLGNSISMAAAMQVTHRLNLPKLVPSQQDGLASFQALAERCGQDPVNLTRVVRLTTTAGFFCEPKPGFVAHNAWSRALNDAILWDNMGIMLDEIFPAAARLADAMQGHLAANGSKLSGWALSHNVQVPFFEELEAHYPERLATVQRGMLAPVAVLNAAIFAANFAWDKLPARAADPPAERVLFVDIGGGLGPVSSAVAIRFDFVDCVIEDLPRTCAQARVTLAEDVRASGRVSFVEHNFFDDQPVHGADVYYLRAICRDWPDKMCIRILQALIPALRSGARIVINDPFMPEEDEKDAMPREQLQAIRSFDLAMLALFNSRDRRASEWEKIFHDADPRFKYLGSWKPNIDDASTPAGAVYGIVEAEWSGQ